MPGGATTGAMTIPLARPRLTGVTPDAVDAGNCLYRWVDRSLTDGASRELGATGYLGSPPGPVRVVVHSVATFVIVLAVGLTCLATAPRLAGYRPVVVTSGSMMPAIQPADVVITSRHDGSDLAEGAVIEFDIGSGSTLHRIASLEVAGYRTAGDANRNQDSTPVPRSEVGGVGVAVVPFVGLPNLWVSRGEWLKLAAAVAFILTALWCARSTWLEDAR